MGGRVCPQELQAVPERRGMLRVPSAYAESYLRARRVDPATAENYIRHTYIGDPVMDAVVDDLADVARADASRFIRAGMEQQAGALRSARSIIP